MYSQKDDAASIECIITNFIRFILCDSNEIVTVALYEHTGSSSFIIAKLHKTRIFRVFWIHFNFNIHDDVYTYRMNKAFNPFHVENTIHQFDVSFSHFFLIVWNAVARVSLQKKIWENIRWFQAEIISFYLKRIQTTKIFIWIHSYTYCTLHVHALSFRSTFLAYSTIIFITCTLDYDYCGQIYCTVILIVASTNRAKSVNLFFSSFLTHSSSTHKDKSCKFEWNSFIRIIPMTNTNKQQSINEEASVLRVLNTTAHMLKLGSSNWWHN